jgi:glyoxylase I family protein
MKFRTEHLGLAAQAPAALKEWYVKALGAKLALQSGATPPAYLLALPGGLLLEIYQGEEVLDRTGCNSLAGWRHLALRVNSIAQAKRTLMKRGVNFPEPIKPAGGGGRVLFFRDPEGNLLHLVERPKNSIFRRAP